MIWTGLCVLSIFLSPVYVKATEGNYKVIEIKNNYCIASNGLTSLLLYETDCNFGDEFYVDSFEEIHSLHNLHQFCFSDYMHSKNIYEQGLNPSLISSSHSLKSWLYSHFKDSKYHRMYLYGIYDEECIELFARLSIPLLMVLYWLEKLFKLKMNDRLSELLILLIALIYGFLFTFKVNLIRYIVFKVGKLIFSKWEYSFSFSLFLFLLIVRKTSTDFVLIFYVGMQFISHFIDSKWLRSIYSTLFLIFIQLIYFHEIDILFTLFFSMIRNVHGILFILSFLLPSIFQWIVSFNFSFPSLSVHFVPNFIFILLFISLCISLYLKHKKTIYIFILFCIYPFASSYMDPFFHVYMFDIGQGDCTLIVEPFHKSTIMIDCAGNLYRDNAKDVILPVLNDLHISSLDYLILTHDDFDHSGAKDSLMDCIQIDHIIEDSNESIDVEYPFYSLLEERDSIDENDSSIISYFSYDSLHYLWMGDASKKVEKELVDSYDLDVDVLKLGHHGSNTSSSLDFLETIHPKLGLISVGFHNKYNHPSNETIVNCNRVGINILETKDVGMIHIFSFHFLSFVECANGIISYI